MREPNPPWIPAGLRCAALAGLVCVLGLVGACGDGAKTPDGATRGDTSGTGCSPTNCKGCCAGNTCREGKAVDACGAGGLPCIACPAGNTCNGQNCTGPAERCGPANCKGCCSGSLCLTGDTDIACGSAGQACKKCGGKGCDKGSCKGSSKSCGSCSGCCQGTTCQPGTSDSACGTGGVDCVTCGSGKSCTSGSCTSPNCGPGICTGCCNNDTCESGSTTTACGSGGKACTKCPSGQICSSGACTVDPTSTWSITIVSAELDTSKSWDTWPANSKPDAYVKSKVGSVSFKNTSTASNTYTPVWNDTVGTITASALFRDKLTIEIRDADPLGSSELIGACIVSVPETVLLAGAGAVSQCGTYVNKISFGFKRQ